MDHTLDLDSNGHDLVRSTTLDTDGGNIGGSTASAGASNSSTSGLRRFPHSLRSRSTRIIRPREQPPLAQVLHLAASAIAAQLSGHGGSSMSNMQPLAGNGFDGTIQSFVQTLQQAASAQARGNGDHNEADDGHLPPVNFLRVFSFPNSETGNGTNNPIDGDSSNPNNGLASDRMDLDQGNPDDRTVTLVLVGVRSMPHGEGTTGDDRNPAGTSLDALLNLPFLPPSNLLRNGSSGALLRSPRGPSPPPSTPAAMSSGQSTPIRRPSSASAMQPPTLPDLSEDPSTSNPREATSADSSHYRRRSDSEFARRPELSSGATRRNGVVEPDTNTTPSGGRSWLIYVVGTNVSPDHPAFTMPSLFTDNPSYEDMQLLSSMLGPVKPPVATQSDVVSSGGLYRLVVNGSSLVAQPQSGDLQPITMQIGERCLICLCDYEGVEEVRQLNKCKHVYHRECIDEWLTTGRNSCPLCRGQGVDEKSSDNQEPTTTASSVA
ncbi:putative ring finger protein [Phaeomoniella chlamydospora]|uniref:Putative ring finger protein n=1 Tax=Phaeomoniella chlamydospora TaxID=158046 RepID=A0A0G2EVZ6_PHACM|nr:putative ring finger protein [Phaeomoniella chlamydospora]